MTAFQPGDVIGRRYRLIELLGAGAMGIVWSARNDAIDRGFAIKLMRPDATTNPNRVQRFFREAKAAGRLRHRCIIEVYDIGTIDEGEPRAGTPYLVMELLEGEPLDAVLKRLKRLPVGTALHIASDVARGLHRAHEQRIVHRDLKPGNLFLHKSIEEDGKIVPKILDFGVSKLLDKMEASETTIGTILGSPGYMAPEQTWGAEDLDGRADVWSLGVVLYKILSGALPFEGSNFHAMLMAINSVEPKPLAERAPDVPPEVCALVHKCLQKKPENRFQSAAELADAIDVLRAEHVYPAVDLADVVRMGRPREAARTTTLTHATQPTHLRTTTDEHTAPLMTASATAPMATSTATSPTLPLVEAKPESARDDVVAAAVAESSEPSTLPRRPRGPRYATFAVGLFAAAALIVALFVRSHAPATTTAASIAPTLPAPAASASTSAFVVPTADPAPAATVTPSTSSPIAAPKPRHAPKTVVKPPPPKKSSEDAAHEGILHAGF